ncbi:hypothetical protein GCM10007853_03980 [Algimonas ampicilliniresistens]|uniref:Ribonuclease n=1 Tax=Algimonas ampicilliniresistens TaxID=1298735 RepID=A0ABQ5V6C2_9PROT|nr:hypothetical protein GCM10007853_03980 [Algimonas ampicilliniresistens]
MPPDGFVGGRAFKNREGKLPANGQYREFDVGPKVPGQSRNSERIVVDDANDRAYFTDDHYGSFREIE